MKLAIRALLIVLACANLLQAADFDVGINIESTSPYKKHYNMPEKLRQELKAAVANRFDVPQDWLSLMNPRQLYDLELAELAALGRTFGPHATNTSAKVKFRASNRRGIKYILLNSNMTYADLRRANCQGL